MTHEQKIATWIGRGKVGAEIVFDRADAGGGVPRLPGFSPPPVLIHLRRESGWPITTAAGAAAPVRLPFRSSCLDYVAAPNVLHRLANPVAALVEWQRVLRPDGMLYLTVPDRRRTADHTRPLTPVDELLRDYLARTTDADPTHVDEFVYEMDWARHAPKVGSDDLPGEKAALARRLREAAERGIAIDMPFHTFEAGNVRELVNALQHWPPCPFDWELLDLTEDFSESDPVGVLACIVVHKGWLARAEAEAFDAVFGADRASAIYKPSPIPFETLIEATRAAAPARKTNPTHLLIEYSDERTEPGARTDNRAG